MPDTANDQLTAHLSRLAGIYLSKGHNITFILRWERPEWKQRLVKYPEWKTELLQSWQITFIKTCHTKGHGLFYKKKILNSNIQLSKTMLYTEDSSI